MHQHLMEYLDNENAERKKCLKKDLQDSVIPSTDVFSVHAMEQKQGHKENIVKLKGSLQDLDKWLSEARRLE